MYFFSILFIIRVELFDLSVDADTAQISGEEAAHAMLSLASGKPHIGYYTCRRVYLEFAGI